MPSTDSALDDLAARVGVEPGFQNSQGERITTSAVTKRHLLDALGFRAESEEDLRAGLLRLEAQEWSRSAPPVTVCYLDEPASVEIVRPATTSRVRWLLTLERGETLEGEAAFGALAFVASGCGVERRRLPLPDGLPIGYHGLSIDGGAQAALFIAPRKCWLPPAMAAGERMWGLAIQLYLLRAAQDWGIGSFGELDDLIDMAARHGASVIGLNPLHALFPDQPEQASPYSPASRLLLNYLYIDVERAARDLTCPQTQAAIAQSDAQREIESLRAAPQVRYAEIAKLKLRLLDGLFAEWRAKPQALDSLATFRRGRGGSFEAHCVFLALRTHFAAADPQYGDWRAWPEDFRDPGSPAVARFVREHSREVEFWAWTQMVAEAQLEEAARRAAGAGMTIGLYRDLAVGADPAGAETWANPDIVLSSVSVGAPPDLYNPAGQNWGLAAFHPRALRGAAYRPFIELLRANMRHAGALRIDHAMGLQHLYLIPSGETPHGGGYAGYDVDEMLAIVAIESHRGECLVVGEDLGTVPQNFRERMAEAQILSYRVLFFERDANGFVGPEDYPALAVAVAGNHDLATLRGWLQDADIALKDRLGFLPGDGEAQKQRSLREAERADLLLRLQADSLLKAGSSGDDPRAFEAAAHGFLARCAAALALAQIDDVTEEGDQVNVPGASEEHPNWRRRLSLTLEEIEASGALRRTAQTFARRGGR